MAPVKLGDGWVFVFVVLEYIVVPTAEPAVVTHDRWLQRGLAEQRSGKKIKSTTAKSFRHTLGSLMRVLKWGSVSVQNKEQRTEPQLQGTSHKHV